MVLLVVEKAKKYSYLNVSTNEFGKVIAKANMVQHLKAVAARTFMICWVSGC